MGGERPGAGETDDFDSQRFQNKVDMLDSLDDEARAAAYIISTCFHMGEMPGPVAEELANKQLALRDVDPEHFS